VPPLFLIGFMAAGKSSVGRALARELGRAFLDLDDLIAARGEPVATLLARDPVAFRAREAEVLEATIATTGDAVIATGGGAAAYGENLARMRGAGCVIALAVDVDAARVRAVGGPARPLLDQPVDKLSALAAGRAPIYRRAHAVVDTNGRTVEQVVALVREAERAYAMSPGATTTVVALGERSYPVTVGAAFVATGLGRPSKVAIITDRNVAAHWRATAEAALATFAPVTIVLEPGEAHKTFATYEGLCDQLIGHGLDRSSVIVALGGGVVGDVAGFVAATLFRGIAVIQWPTTIVAMTDAAIGGKTAVDTAAGKNLVGAFWQPRSVVCNLATLATLPQRERRAGFGELWKYALLDGPELWSAVERCAAWASAGGAPPPALDEVIARSVAYKSAVVGRDELERTGHRALLNLGHTVGHAIESHTGLLHGEAVGLGLVVACRVSTALGLASKELEASVAGALQRTGLPHDPDPYLRDEVLARLQLDKKRTGDRVKFIAVRDVGTCEPVDITLTELGRILRVEVAP
jgi:shikimate kinase/3-dehydroquinate synthase